MSKLSVIVPVWNEEGNIESLVMRMHEALNKHIQYEIVFIDDRSTDKSVSIIKSLARTYPVTVRSKKASRGKAQSIIEGIGYARYPLIAMIDADLQYPPEALMGMVRMIEKNGFDVVVGNRVENHTSIHRKIIHDACRWGLGKVLHNLDCDIQSGLKVFKREICNNIPMNPSPWAFDLEFLVHARNAGYTIGNYDIVFDKRNSGEPKINLLEGAWQIGLSALKLKFKRYPRVAYSYD